MTAETRFPGELLNLMNTKFLKSGKYQDLRASELLTAWMSWEREVASSSYKGGWGETLGHYVAALWQGRLLLLPSARGGAQTSRYGNV